MGERIERRDLRDLEKCAITQNKMEDESVTDGRTVNTTNYAHFKHDQKLTVTPNSQPDNNRKNSELHIKVICKSITSHIFPNCTKLNLFWPNLSFSVLCGPFSKYISPKLVAQIAQLPVYLNDTQFLGTKLITDTWTTGADA